MPRNLNLFLLMILLFVCSVAMAGDEKGNGGDAVVCRSSSGHLKKIELLDYFEARVMRNIQIDLGSGSFDEKVKKVLERLKRVAPIRAKLYEGWYSEFMKEASLLPGIELVDLPDSGHLVLPKGCRVEQLAIRRIPERESDKRYVINKDLWDALDQTGRAGLILHELIYREMSSLGEQDSIGSRYFNSLVSSRQVETMTRYQLVRALKDIGIPTAEWDQWIFDLKAGTPLSPDGVYLEQAVLYGEQFYQKIKDKRDDWQEFYLRGRIQFYPSGAIKRAHIADRGRDNYQAIYIAGRPYLLATGTPFEFYPDGTLKEYFTRPVIDAFVGKDYRLRPWHLGGAGDQTPIFIAQNPKGEIRACSNCEGFVLVDGQSVRIGINPATKVEVADYLDKKLSSIENPSIAWSLPTEEDSPYVVPAEFYLAQDTLLEKGGRKVLFAAGSQIDAYGGISGILKNPTMLPVAGKDALFVGEVQAYWYESEGGSPGLFVYHGTLAEETILKDIHGSFNSYSAGTEIWFGRGLVSESRP